VNDGVSSRVAPLAPERYSLQLTMSQELHDKLRHAQRLLGHVVKPGDVAAVLERALDVLIEKLEKRKCGAAARRAPRRASKSARHVPAHVREAVWERDGGRCTFVSDAGKRCDARERLEYDHVLPVARGGEATVEGLRLLCRAHNQWEAERTFGAGFMAEKREQAKRAAEAKREAARAQKAAEADPDASVIPWLRSLGVRADQAKRAAEAVAHMVEAPIEERVKAAFAFYGSVRFPNKRGPQSSPASCSTSFRSSSPCRPTITRTTLPSRPTTTVSGMELAR
jgi:5-methylcytosine-specific restriction endonuclease McrA